MVQIFILPPLFSINFHCIIINVIHNNNLQANRLSTAIFNQKIHIPHNTYLVLVLRIYCTFLVLHKTCNSFIF